KVHQLQEDATARISARQSHYSIPTLFSGRRAQVRLGARTVTVLGGGTKVAEHVRSIHKYTEIMDGSCGAGMTRSVHRHSAGLSSCGFVYQHRSHRLVGCVS